MKRHVDVKFEERKSLKRMIRGDFSSIFVNVGSVSSTKGRKGVKYEKNYFGLYFPVLNFTTISAKNKKYGTTEVESNINVNLSDIVGFNPKTKELIFNNNGVVWLVVVKSDGINSLLDYAGIELI